MSVRISPEQRQINQLRRQITVMEQAASKNNSRNRDLERLLENTRKELERANRKYADNLRRQKEETDRLQTTIRVQGTALRNLDNQIKEKERQQNIRIAAIQSRHEADIKQLNEDYSKQNRELHQAISATRTEMRNEFIRVRQETDNKLRQQEMDHNRQMRQLREEMSESIKEVDNKLEDLIADLKNREDGEKQLAVYWLEQAARLYDEMQDNYRPQLFIRKPFEKLRDRIRIYQQDLKDGRFSSAADGGRSAFYDAMDMKEELVTAEVEWNFWMNAARERNNQLLQSLQAAENRSYEITVDGEQIIDDSGIDYWTDGQLSIVRDRITQIQNDFAQIEEKPTEYLQELDEKLRGLQEELALVENASQTNLAMSLDRYNLANQIGQILGSDFQMVDADGDYFAEENREEYHALFENPVTGDRAAVVITPIKGEDGLVTNHAEVIIDNADHNPATRAAINSVVESNLSNNLQTQIQFPCADKYGAQTGTVVSNVGDIESVTAGNRNVLLENQ